MKALIVILSLMLLSGCYSAPQNTPESTVSPLPESTQTPEPSPEITPEHTPESTKEPDKIIASFSTKVYDKSKNRVQNLKLAAKAVNGTVVKPGETFSFNKIVGPRTAEKGYKEAPVLIGKEHTTGLGGGVCQVSTTLFNAAQKAGLSIIERHTHDIEVVYAKNGTDATVSYGTLDMKFKNTKEYSILIRSSASNSKVSVTLIAQ
jgi:vancomycin resistance protein YoaR